jgi:hypothetical protein
VKVDLETIASVTRSNLPDPLGELDINDGVAYVLGKNLRVASMSWRRETVSSPFAHGRFPIHETKDAAEASLSVYVLGEDHTTLQSNLGELLEAFTGQYEYLLKLQVEGQDYQWRCERSDYQVGFATETLVARFLPVELSFFRHPIPVAGVI